MLQWKWNASHVEQGRLQRAKSVILLNDNISHEDGICSAECIGSEGEIHKVSLSKCTCVDFSTRRLPCKHMLKLAMLAHLINADGLTSEEENEAFLKDITERSARAYGYYYLINKPIITDKEYDNLKFELIDWGIIPEPSQDSAVAPEIASRHPDISESEAAATDSSALKDTSPSDSDSDKSIPFALYGLALKYVHEAKIEYLDKVSKGGGLYVFNKQAADEMQKIGFNVQLAANGIKGHRNEKVWFIAFRNLRK